MLGKVLVLFLVVCGFSIVLIGISAHSHNSDKTQHDLDESYELALRLTKEAGKVVKDKIWKAKSVETKSTDIDFVTETDQQVEKMLKGNISSHFPNHKFIGEESTAGGAAVTLADAPTWIIDPIDGTMNFVHGLPMICISVALKVNKQTELGIIYNPVLDELFTARRGKGAFYNGKPARVSDKTDLSKALLSMAFGPFKEPEFKRVNIENMKELYGVVHGYRSLGAAALSMAYVAMGGMDAYFEHGIHAWDVAAGDIIVREAGGVVIDPTGGPFDLMSRKVLCASTKKLADQLISKIQNVLPSRDM